MKQYRFTLSKINTLSGLINEIIDSNNSGRKPVSLIDIEGFVRCFSAIEKVEYSTKYNEDDSSVHLGIYEEKTLIAAITYINESQLTKVA